MSVETQITTLVEHIATEMKAINDLAWTNLFWDFVVNETLQTRLPQTASNALLVWNAKTKWRFEGRTWWWTSDNIWDLIQTWTWMTIWVDWILNGSRYLKITSWTTINQETIIMSKETFKPPFLFSFWLTLSQRIANTEVHIELVEVDENWDVIIDTELFTAPNFNNARSGVWLKYDWTSSSSASIKVRSRWISELVKTATSHWTSFSVATWTAPNFNPTLQGDISFNADRVITSWRAIDSNVNRTEWGRSTTYVPDPDWTYKIRLRVKNLWTAPASSTDVRLHFWKIIDHTRVSVDFWAISWSLNWSDAIPVNATMLGSTSLQPSASYWYSLYHHKVSDWTTNATSVKTSSWNIWSIVVSNNGASLAYFKLYNKASAPTVWTDIPIQVYMIKGWETISINPGWAYWLRCTTWIAYAITWWIANNDMTAILANEVAVSISYI